MKLKSMAKNLKTDHGGQPVLEGTDTYSAKRGHMEAQLL